MELARRLYECKAQEMYCPQYETWEVYIQDVKNLSLGTANKLVHIYETFVKEYGISEQKIAEIGGWSVVSEIMPMVKDQKSAEEWLEKARILHRKDLRKEVQEAKSGVSMITCQHLDVILIKKCKACGDTFL